MTDLHQATFSWPAGPSKVIVTGTFDNWSKSIQLDKTDSGFSKTLGVPWGSKVIYKYFVDGQWRASPSAPQEYTDQKYMNNVYTSPPKPVSSVSEATDSVLATHGAPSLVSYVASGVGAAIATVTGIDPINSQQIPVPETPVSAKPVNSVPEPIHDEPVVLHLPSDTVKTASSDSRGDPIPNAPEPYKLVNGTLPGELDHPRHSTAAHSSQVIPPAEQHAEPAEPHHSTAAHSSQVIPPADRHPETTTPAVPSTTEEPHHSTAAHPSEVVHKPEESTTTASTAVESTTKEAAAAPTTPPNKEASLPRTSGGSPPTTPRKFSFQRSRGSVSGSIGSADSSPSKPKKKKRESILEKIKDVFHHHDHHHDKKENASST